MLRWYLQQHCQIKINDASVKKCQVRDFVIVSNNVLYCLIVNIVAYNYVCYTYEYIIRI